MQADEDPNTISVVETLPMVRPVDTNADTLDSPCGTTQATNTNNNNDGEECQLISICSVMGIREGNDGSPVGASPAAPRSGHQSTSELNSTVDHPLVDAVPVYSLPAHEPIVKRHKEQQVILSPPLAEELRHQEDTRSAELTSNFEKEESLKRALDLSVSTEGSSQTPPPMLGTQNSEALREIIKRKKEMKRKLREEGKNGEGDDSMEGPRRSSHPEPSTSSWGSSFHQQVPLTPSTVPVANQVDGDGGGGSTSWSSPLAMKDDEQRFQEAPPLFSSKEDLIKKMNDMYREATSPTAKSRY